jgi:glutamine phosphoribosylpyrophosphate amidotransferase
MDLVQATQLKKNSLCHACFTGKYSVPINGDFRKNILEKKYVNNEWS